MKFQSIPGRFARTLITLIVFLSMAAISGCTLPISPGEVISNPDMIEKAQVILTVKSLKPLETGEQIEFVIVDEVTGIPYHQEKLAMSPMKDGSFGIVYPATIGSVITYFFQKFGTDGHISPELSADGSEIRYRMFHVREPGLVKETVASWADAPPDNNLSGQISGVIVSDGQGEPLSDILVSAGGIQTITDASGRFTLFPLAPGQHNLIAISMTGTYLPAQNSAIVANGKVTQTSLAMETTSWKEVTFRVKLPEDSIEGAPVRLAGNLSQLGNTFQDLGGGISLDASKMPVFNAEDSGWYTLSMILPAGVDIRYKYTLGDGFWNAEHGLDQSFVTHQVILPMDSGMIQIEDQVASWRSSSTETIWFRAALPDNTPADEIIGIQFKIGEWLPALPMLKIAENSWAYPLISPHNFSGEIPYRYCRETPCAGLGQGGIESLETVRKISTNFKETHLNSDVVSGWAYISGSIPETASLMTAPIAREITAGISISPFSSHEVLGPAQTNHIVLSPVWVTNPIGHPRMLAPSLSLTMQSDKINSIVRAAQDQGKTISLHPQILFQHTAAKWWESQPTGDESFWLNFLTEYRQYIYQYADLAAYAGADRLIIGGAWLLPALPVGDNFITYTQPGNIESLWEEIIQGVKARYPGDLGFVVTTDMSEDPPGFLSEVDTLFLLWDPPLPEDLSTEQIQTELSNLLDTLGEPFVTQLEKPLITMLAIPSLKDYHLDCIPSPNDEGVCVDTSNLKLGPALQNPAAADLQMQAEYYSAFLTVISQREWVSGVVSLGYYPDLALHDTSASIHGKPAEEIFTRWLTQVSGN